VYCTDIKRRQMHYANSDNIKQEEFEDTKGIIRIRISKKKTTQRPNEKVQRGKQRSTKHTYKTKDRVTQTPLKTGGELSKQTKTE
jgi:hypothetical protein